MMARDLQVSELHNREFDVKMRSLRMKPPDPTREYGETPNIDRVVTGMYLSTNSDTSGISVCSVNRSLRILFRWAFSR